MDDDGWGFAYHSQSFLRETTGFILHEVLHSQKKGLLTVKLDKLRRAIVVPPRIILAPERMCSPLGSDDFNGDLIGVRDLCSTVVSLDKCRRRCSRVHFLFRIVLRTVTSAQSLDLPCAPAPMPIRGDIVVASLVTLEERASKFTPTRTTGGSISFDAHENSLGLLIGPVFWYCQQLFSNGDRRLMLTERNQKIRGSGVS